MVVDNQWLKENDATDSEYLFRCSFSELYVDGTKLGNLTRYINHADSEPNTVARIVNHWGVSLPVLHACRNISEGVELTIDYRAGNADQSKKNKPKKKRKGSESDSTSKTLSPLFPRKQVFDGL
eukprot:g76309.t1